jgi:GntR family transcriptional regulator
MTKWYLDKDSKVPLYLQLKDQIKYHISTGNLQQNEQLPAVNKLAKELAINFETVRKAYKELEKEGLISMQRAKGTLVTLERGAPPLVPGPARSSDQSPERWITNAVSLLLARGESPESVRAAVVRAMEEAFAERKERFVIFTECNPLQVHDISNQLKTILNEDVRPVLLEDLEREVSGLGPDERRLRAVVTTGFHLNDVRAALGGRSIDVHVLITNMSPESRRKIDEIGTDRRFGFICRDQESIPLYNDLLRAEFGKKIKLSPAYLGDAAGVEAVLHSVDILLVTPPVFREVKRLAPPNLPVFNVFDRVDPMSLRILRDRLGRESP